VKLERHLGKQQDKLLPEMVCGYDREVKTLELIITSGLVVLIWIIQILHYPSFLYVDKANFAEFEAFHANRISLIVIPLMLTEAALAFYGRRPAILSILILIWLSTFFLQVPCHHKLQLGHDEATIKKLISTNWIRTFLWSLKLILLIRWYPWNRG
jgi:hypothetical protein